MNKLMREKLRIIISQPVSQSVSRQLGADVHCAPRRSQFRARADSPSQLGSGESESSVAGRRAESAAELSSVWRRSVTIVADKANESLALGAPYLIVQLSHRQDNELPPGRAPQLGPSGWRRRAWILKTIRPAQLGFINHHARCERLRATRAQLARVRMGRVLVIGSSFPTSFP